MRGDRKPDVIASLLDLAFPGDNRVALARAISAVANDQVDAKAVCKAIHGRLGRAHVIGITGAPGVGKSTLINALIRELRGAGKTVGVVAVDPSSPVTGGAILGDRIRMSEHGADDGVFVRSLASRGHLGGLSRSAARVVDVMDAAGFDVIIVETVGIGQSEVEIIQIAQTTVVVYAPGLGDEVQAMKAGILEIADVLVVNKADMPLVAQTETQLRDAVETSHSDGWQVPVLRAAATTGEGVQELCQAIAAHRAQLEARNTENAARRRIRTLIAAGAAEQVRRLILRLDDSRLDHLCDLVMRGEVDLYEAASKAMHLVSSSTRTK